MIPPSFLEWSARIDDRPAARERALQAIAEAFRGVTRTGGVSLHETVPIDNYEGSAARAAARKLDVDHRWEDVPHADLAEICGIGGMAFLDPIGWRYYLPAYMTWWLRGGEAADSLAADEIIWTLQLSKGGKNPLRGYDLERYATLNRRQTEAVVRFLRCVADHAEEESTRDDATKALTSYWDDPAKPVAPG